MGGEASQPQASEDGPASEADKDAAYDRMFAGETDAEKAFGEAYADDPQTLEEIRRLVALLDGHSASKKDVSAEMQRLQGMADELERKEKKVRHKEENAAASTADNWLQDQLLKSEADAAQKAAEERAEERAGERREKAEEERAMKENAQAAIAAGRVARAEAEVRARLFAGASDVIRAREVEEGSVMGKLPLPLLPPPAPEVDEAPPPPAVIEKAEVTGEVPEYYRLLGIGVEATFDEIKKGYRRQALRWHPDKNRHRLEEATDQFQKISEAFDTLYDAERRVMYDAGKNKDPAKMRKLAGAGWSSLSDEDDAALTPQGWKWKQQSWRAYVLTNGRIDDDPEFVQEIINTMDHPRLPMEKTKLFWRFLGEMACLDRDKAERDDWLFKYIGKVWNGTPSHWPKAAELKAMNDAGQQEWKERRLVYNRRRTKLRLYIDMHDEYMAISDRSDKERDRLTRGRPRMAKFLDGTIPDNTPGGP